MKIKTLNKNLIIFLTMLTMIMSVFMLSACGKKDPEEKPFEARTLTVEQAKTVFNEAVTKAKQATNVSAELLIDEDLGVEYMANSDTYLNIEGETQYDWSCYEDGEWFSYSYLDIEEFRHQGHKRKLENETATTGVELLVDSVFGSFMPDVSAGTQTAENKYVLYCSATQGEDPFEAVCEVVDGSIVKLTISVTIEGETQVGEMSFEYNVEDLEIPQLPDVEWIEN